jgi:hypothetical protein
MNAPPFAVVRLLSGWAAVYCSGPKRLAVVETRSRYGNLCGFSSKEDARLALEGDLARGLVRVAK